MVEEVVRLFRGGKAGNREAKAQVGKVSWVKVGRRQGPGKARSSGYCWGVPRKCQVPRRSLEAGANQTQGRLGAKTLKTFTTRPSWVALLALLALLPWCRCSPQSLARHQPSIRLSKKPGPRTPASFHRLPSSVWLLPGALDQTATLEESPGNKKAGPLLLLLLLLPQKQKQTAPFSDPVLDSPRTRLGRKWAGQAGISFQGLPSWATAAGPAGQLL